MKVLVLLLAFVLVCSFAVAEETSPAIWDNSLGTIGNKVRECTSGHIHDYTDNDTIYQDNDVTPDFAYGAGVDLVVYESNPDRTGIQKFIPDSVEVQGKYDFANENGSTFVVARYNIWKLLTKKR